MPKTAFVSFAFILVFCLAASMAEAGFFEERLQVIDEKYQDEVFGGDKQMELIITFTPGDDLTYDEGESNGVEGDWAIIVDADDDGDFNDDTVIASGDAVSGSVVEYRLHRNSLSHLPDGKYEVAAIIDNLANGKLDWEGEVTSKETLSLLFRIKDEYQITLVDFILALDNGEVPAGLRQEFVSNGILLFLSVIVEEPGSEWLIADQDRIYPIRKNVDENRLDVYEFDFSVGLEFQDDLDNVFNAGSGYESQLDSGTLPQGLRNEFASEGITLSENITVNIIDLGEKWTITDNDSGDKYVATKRGSSLNINAAISLPGISGNATVLVEESGSRWYIIDGSDTYVVRQELDRIKVYDLLASVDLGFQAELDNGIISDDLQGEFETEGIVFDVTVADITDYVSEPELRRWRIITTSGRIYVVQFDNSGENENDDDSDELEIYSEDVLLFIVRTGFGHISELLDMDIIPAVLRLEFEKNGIMLSETANVDVQDPGSAWLITGSTYAVRKEGDKLNVYEYSSVTKSDKADDDTEDFTLDRTLEITELVVDPEVFSPNGDGVRDTVTIYYTLSESLSIAREEISITIGEDQLTSPARPRPSVREGRNSVMWDGKDGLGKVVVDGIYTVEIQANDRGGNEATKTIQVEVGTEMPEVANTEPPKYSYVSALTQVRAQLQDTTGEGLDLTASRIRLKDASRVQIPGSQRDDGVNFITWLIQPPLPGDGSADGEYTIVVTTVDKAGNSETTNYPFFYDTVFPRIVAVIPADGSVLDEPPSVIEIVMNDGQGSGPDLGTTAQSMTLRLDGNVVNGSTIHNGVDSVVFIPFKELEIGVYTIQITPTDFADNKPSEPLQFQFTLVEDLEDILPEVVSTEPRERSAVNRISQVSAVLKDNSGKGIDIDESTVSLVNSAGVVVPGVQTDDGDTTIAWELTSPLPTNGSADGSYIIKVKAVDKANRTNDLNFTFTYDTKVPVIASITPADGSILTTSPTQVVMNISDGTGSGVDFAASLDSMSLSGVEGNRILREDNGVDTMTFSFPALEDTGRYTVEVTLKDKAGNEYIYSSRFDLVEKPTDVLPEVVSTEPPSRAYVNALTQVSAELRDNSGKGISLDASSIRLQDPSGVEVAGVQTDDDASVIAWELISPLPADGSVDGTYTIVVNAVDKTGGVTDYTSSFLYDTKVPVIASITPANGSVLTTPPTRVVMTVSDGTGSGVDFAASLSSMSLSGVEGNRILREANGVDTMTFSFPALEDTGRYTVEVTLKDKAGNEYIYSSRFDLVEKPTDVLPEVVSTDPPSRAYVNALTRVSAELKDNSGKGLSLDASSIRLQDPSGAEVAGVQTDDDASAIAWELISPLPADGSVDGTYTIVVNAVDKTGGVTDYTSTFLYDTKVPVIASITPADGSILTTSPTQVVMTVSDGAGSGMDFAASLSSMSLSGVEGNRILREDNGVDTMTFSFPALEDTGRYTVEVTLRDKAGNEYIYSSRFDLVEKPTDVLPEVVSTDPPSRAYVNALTRVSAELKDNSGKGISLDASSIGLQDPSGAEVAGVQTDDDASTIVWELISPLPADGSVDGTYTIVVNAVDKTGGVTDYTSTFLYDTKVPVIASITPADGSILTVSPTQVVMTVSDGAGGGVDFAASLSSMSLSGVEGNRILREANGVDTMTFSFPALEDTGRYTVEVTLRDKAGNEYIYSSRFDLVEKPTDVLPEVVSTDPPSRAYVNALTQVSAELKDNSGKGISLDTSSIRLQDPSGAEVAGVQTDDDTSAIAWELISPLPADGSVDGTYTIVVNAADKTGGVTDYTSTFLYDTKVPVIASITPADGSILTTSPTQVVMTVSDGAGGGVDFAASLSSMSLSGVEGNRILREDNGVDTMTFSFPALENTGRYTIEVTLKDKAGNEYIYSSRFDLVEKPTDVLPEVVSTSPPARAYVNVLTQVSAVLEEGSSGKGISLDASSIRLEDPSGAEVAGVQTDDDASAIAWELISPLPADGSVDGTYTIVVNAVDKTGGVTDYTSTFLYDTLLPSVVATTPAANDAFYEGISQVTVQLDDGDGSGVDLSGTGVELQGPTGNVQAARSDNGKDTITLTFSKLTESGNYVIQIDPRDRAGNSGYPVKIKFSYVLKPPAVKSVTLTNRAYVSNLESIEAVLEDRSGIGLDLSETGSSIVVTGPDGVLQADQTSVGEDTIIWQPVHPLAKDGTDDGEYGVTVTPVDTTGGSGQSRNYTLIYDTQPPEVVFAAPVDINADVTHVGQQLSFVQARLQDEGPADIEIEDQVIYVEAPDVTQIPGVQTDDDVDMVNWNLTNPLAKDGTADGIYTVVVEAIDRAGNAKEFRYPLVYDTLVPTVVEVSPENDSLLDRDIMQVWARLEDTGDGEIDFGNSGIELRKPDGSIISGLLSNDGVSTLTFTFAGLEENGVYTMLVTAADKAGNGSETRWKTEFVFRTGLPVVYSTTPITDSPDRAFVNTQLTEVRVRLRETDGGGIDRSPTGSEIKLRGPDGNLIIGSQINSGADTLIFRLSRPRATDGTEDGEYTILVMGVNAAKRRYDGEEEFKFTYDTQDPKVEWVSYINVNAELSYVHEQITDLEARLKDEGPAGIDVNRSSIRLIDPSGQVVNADASDNEVDTLRLEFPAGLPMEGSFTLEINAVDKARNSTTVRTAFIYAVSLPKVVSTTPITVPAKNAFTNAQIKDVRAELSETGNSGIDLSPTGSTIRLRGPRGDVPGVQSNSSNNVLIFTLTNPLAADGSDDGVHTILVTPVNAAKLKGQPVEFSFTYDTVAPEVDVDDITIGLAVATGSSLSDMSAIVKDEEPSSGIDWENADSSWIKLRDSSGRDISGRVIINPDESRITLLLDVPLASNGGDDGFYSITVVPKDKAGNSPEPKSYEFLYDTRPPTVSKAEITLNEKPLLLDSSLEEYPTAVNTKGGVTIVAKMEDEGAGVDLTLSSIRVMGPGDQAVSGSLKQNGVDTMWLTSGLLNEEGRYKVEINPVDLDGNGINTSSETIFTEFLFEQHKPEVTLTEPTADEEAEDEPIRLRGTATDESGGEGDQRVEASGVAKVEIGGTGPGDVPLDWVQAIDDSDADQKPWSKWYLDFLPDVSGTYDMEIRVWDNAGNSEIYDAGIALTFTVELSFQEAAYCWPNPVTSGVAHISFKVNVPEGQTVPVTLYIYDVSGDLVYEEEHRDIPSMARTSVPWDCINNKGEKVITGIYLFRLEAELPDGQKANKVGKPMIIKN